MKQERERKISQPVNDDVEEEKGRTETGRQRGHRGSSLSSRATPNVDEEMMFTTTAESPNAVMVDYPFSKQSDNSANPPSPSFARATHHRANLSLRRCKPSPVFVPLSLPTFLTLQIAVSTETLQGACVVGVVTQ